MKRRPLHLTFALLLATTFSLSCDGPTAPLTPTQLHERIQSEMQKEGIPSLAAAIVKDDQIVWQHTYGFEDLASKTPPTEDTIYLLASISKTITATAVMQLYERGQLDLDTDISTYLSFDIRNPHFPEVPITARMLLTHTSGLAWPTNEEDPHFNDAYPDDSAPPLSSWLKEYLTPGGSQYLATTWKNTRPGAQVQYSNIGGGLLGYLVESITNQDFGEYCKANIFGPLAMSDTGFKLRDVDQTRLATLYHEGKVMGQYSVSHYPASMVRSSLTELSHFLIAIMNGGVYQNTRILEQRTVEEMLRTKVPSEGLSFIWQSQGQGWVGHLGGYWGVTSSLDLNRSHNVGVILLSNTYGVTSLYPNGTIYDLLHEEAEKYFDNQ